MSTIYNMLKNDVEFWVCREYDLMAVSGVTRNQTVCWLMSIQKCIEAVYVNRIRNTNNFIVEDDWVAICVQKSQDIIENLDQYLQIFIYTDTWETFHRSNSPKILSQIICNFIFNEIVNIACDYPMADIDII